jgi:Glycosyltransferase family 87
VIASRRFTSAVALGVSVLFLVCWVLAHTGPLNDEQIVDIPVYEQYGNLMEEGEVPYRDFRLEYPPGALPVFVLPSLVSAKGDRLAYREAFEGLMELLAIAGIACAAVLLQGLRATRRRVVATLTAIAVFPLLLGSVALTRFDLWPATLVLGALAALAWERNRVGFGLLGLAIAVKFYPGVIVPLALSYVWKRHGRREALVCLGLLVGIVLAVFLPFFVLSPDGVAHSIGRQLSRPLQIESLASAIFLVAHQVTGLEIEMRSSHGSQNLVGTGPGVAAVLLSLVQLAVLVWIWLRRPGTMEDVLRWSAAAVTAFIGLGKVLSPQFLIWLAPLVPLVGGRRGVRATAVLAVAMVLTQLWFPSRYWVLAMEFDALASWLVLARDLTLIGLLVLLVTPLGVRDAHWLDRRSASRRVALD